MYTDCMSKSAGGIKKQQAPPYTIEVFEDIGRCFCIGLLDFYEINPVSRIPSSNLKNIEGVKSDLMSHYPIFIPKKKEEEKDTNPYAIKPLRQTKSLQRNQTQRNNFSANGRVIIGSRGANLQTTQNRDGEGTGKAKNLKDKNSSTTQERKSFMKHGSASIPSKSMKDSSNASDSVKQDMATTVATTKNSINSS
jgi:hypothetical protein